MWDNCLTKLESELPAQEFNTWIRPLQAVENNKQIKLLAPNQFVLDWIKEHFLAQIKKSIQVFSGGELDVVLVIGSKPKPNYTGIGKNPAKINYKNKHSSNLNPLFTFDNFVVGKSNQIAKAASLQVTENVGVTYNPLLIYGLSGLGKTHIMHAIGNKITNSNPTSKVLYLHSEKFVQDMVKAFQHNTITAFKDYYRSINVLLIDDIQFFAGKERSQEEFFHTFNTLMENKHQIILTCDKYPKEINGLEDRLKSRFGCGLPVSIDPPDLETRVAILIKKAHIANVNLPQDVAFFIGKHIPFNVRELEGALRRVIASASFTRNAITINFVKEVLNDLISLKNKLIQLDNIQKTVAIYFKIRIADLLSKKRTQSITMPRQIAMLLARELTDHSLLEIGDAFGGRDHTTVINACKKINALRETDNKVAEDFSNLSRILSY